MSGKPAARLGDPTACPIPGHGTNPIAAGSPDVLFDSLPAARMGDASACGGAMDGAVVPTVLINGKPAAVVGSVGSHGNVVVGGSGTVLIGTSGGGAAFSGISPLAITGSFDEQFRVLSDSGEPLAGVPYHIRDAEGRIYKGFTDESGKTPRIFTAGKQELQVSVGVHALELWGQA
ncbi:MAG: PAAR domain-containing protein [Ectopseudomonas guguanensis]|uniref:PAAR domain-containing protein n=1 Tax=Ectopseudomonas guguanensis TaxID=1198456 RepID=UPI00391B5A5D